MLEPLRVVEMPSDSESDGLGLAGLERQRHGQSRVDCLAWLAEFASSPGRFLAVAGSATKAINSAALDQAGSATALASKTASVMLPQPGLPGTSRLACFNALPPRAAAINS